MTDTSQPDPPMEASAATNGILVMDKPPGLSSAQVVSRVKRALNAKKVGHAGTLDPFATGVLVCAVGQATRLTRFLLDGRKTYAAVMRLGIATDTQDLTGTAMAEAPTAHLSPEQIREAGSAFNGVIQQSPPTYSALKHNGTPLYKLARRGTPVQKPPRAVTIHALDIKSIDPPWVHFDVTCSAGTYVRTICNDWGNALGCGGHLHALRRTAASGFSLEEAVTMDPAMTSEALWQHRIPMAHALRSMPAVQVDANLAEWIRFGRPLAQDALSVDSDTVGDQPVQLMDTHHQLIAVVQLKKKAPRYTYCCVF